MLGPRLLRKSRRWAGSISVSPEIMSGPTESSRSIVPFDRSGGEKSMLAAELSHWF
jgi:hypothetical protein